GTLPEGALDGSPYAVTVTVSDGRGAESNVAFAWFVDPLVLRNPGDKVYALNETVSLPLVAVYNGTRPLTYGANGLPPDLSINPSTGAISGTITAASVRDNPYAVTVWVQDDQGARAQQAFAMKVQALKVTFNADPVRTGYLLKDGKVVDG